MDLCMLAPVENMMCRVWENFQRKSCTFRKLQVYMYFCQKRINFQKDFNRVFKRFLTEKMAKC